MAGVWFVGSKECSQGGLEVQHLFLRYNHPMHIITHRRIVEAQRAYPHCASALELWYRLCKKAEWHNFAELRMLFPGTYKVGDIFVFDIGGNKLRLIAAIHFNTGRVFIRAVLPHKEYDQGGWK